MPQAFSTFRIPAFRLLFASGMVSSVSLNVRMLVHGWLVLSLSGDSPFWVGISAAFMGFSQLALAIVGGVVADRVPRRTVLIAEQAVGMVLSLLLAIGIFFHAVTLPLALAASIVIGGLRAFNWTATNAILYDIAGPQRLLNATALWRIAVAPTQIFGSLLAGALIGWAGMWSAYAFIAAAGLVTPLLLLPLRADAQVTRSNGTVLAQALEGLRFVAKDRSLRTIITFSLVMETFGFSFMTMIPVVVKNVLGAGPLALGLLSAAIGTGSLIGLLVVAALGNFHHKSLLVFVNAAGAGLALLLFSFSRSLPLSMALAMATMAFLMAYDLNLVTLLQLLAPPQMRGRVVSMHSLTISFTSIGGFITGGLGSLIGVPAMLAIGGGLIVGNAALRRSHILRVREATPDAPA